MKYIIAHIIIICSLVNSSCQTQKASSESTLNQDYIFNGSFKIIEEDQLGNIYTVNIKNEIKKYSPQLEFLFQFSTNRLGDIYKLDVSNPQKLLVYFGDFQNIIFLDNTLSEMKTLDLQALNMWNIQAVALSADNFIWVYNPINFNMIKINENGRELLSSNELFQGQINNTSDTEIIANQLNVVLKDGEKMVLFDNFGSFQKEMALKIDKMVLIKNLLLYSDGKNIKQESLDIFALSALDDIYNHDLEIIDFCINKENRLLILDKKGVKLTYVQ